MEPPNDPKMSGRIAMIALLVIGAFTLFLIWFSG